jgi:hypothetical protein
MKQNPMFIKCMSCGHATLNEPTNAQSEVLKLAEVLKLSVDALEKINKEELNSMRPGGYYSRSASISFEALVEIRKIMGEL